MSRADHPAGTGLLRPDGLLSSTEAAHVLDCTVMDVAQMVVDGRLRPVVSATGCRYYDPDEVVRVQHGVELDDPLAGGRSLVFGPLLGAAILAAVGLAIWLVLR